MRFSISLSIVWVALGLGAGPASAIDTNGWIQWSPREDIAPRFKADAHGGKAHGAAALKITSTDASQFGTWKKVFQGVQGGQTYRFSAWYRAEKVRDEKRSIITRLQWLDSRSRTVRPPDFVLDVARDGEWKRVELVTPIPTNAAAVEVQLGLGFTDRGTVWWDDVELAPDSSPRDRAVRALTVFHRPRGTKSASESLERFCKLVEGAADEKPDLVCLPEGVTVVGNGKTYAEVSESIPGPSTARLGKLAKDLNSYVVAGIYERSGQIVYNTAVLLDRQGKLVGKYRKTHLPREEWEAGITPGDSYPVFETEFGKIGIMICWDLQFPEPCRAMAAQGAEIVLLPIWGGSDVLAQARAIENHIFLVSATYDMRSFIVDPAGKILAEATKDRPFATATLHLDQKIFQPWLGDMKNRTWKERRVDLRVP